MGKRTRERQVICTYERNLKLNKIEKPKEFKESDACLKEGMALKIRRRL
jgi:hypothetical protein